jgi:two-component system secretion system sensor histidine kinase SalK
VVAFLVFEIRAGVPQGLSALASFGIIVLLLSLAAYVSLSNLNGSRVLTSFAALLILAGWYFLLTMDREPFFGNLADCLLPVILFIMITFLLGFIFQDGVYPHKKTIRLILFVSAILPIILKLWEDRWFSLFHLGQYIISLLCCIFVFITQRKRFAFFIKSEWKNLLPSIGMFCALMAFYIAVFRNEPSYLANSGMFLIICLPLWSIFKVAYHSKEIVSASMPLGVGQSKAIILLVLAVLCGITGLFGLDSMFLLLMTQIALWFFILYYLAMIWNIARKTEMPETAHPHYSYALSRIEKEEALKKQFSDFLHDDVLQDLLSIKNLMSKAERPEVQTLIRETLDKLNRTVREEMQDYHSVMLKDLTLKENYANLLSELAQKFDVRHVEVVFECADDLFLAMPYHLVIYRAMRELVTNAYKHANCTKIHIMLTQINDRIDLRMTDNGDAGEKDLQNAMELRKGNGLLSLQEMITSLGGQFTVSDAKPQGICVRVSLPMKGDGSYQYFAHR